MRHSRPRVKVEPAGGGRYDHLLKKLSGNVDLPACGFAIGDMTLCDCCQSQGLDSQYADRSRSLSHCRGETNESGIATAARARKAGFSTSFLKTVGFGKQFKEAGKSGAHRALILGEEEEQIR